MIIVPIVVGPTGVGKTDVILRIAERTQAEIISADSRQAYRHLDIGTAKPTLQQRRRVIHHMVDCCDPDVKFNAAQYAAMATEIILQLIAEEKLPIVVGGSGLYLKALLGGFFRGPGADACIRTRLTEHESHLGSGGLHRLLEEVDPLSANRIHPHDRVRTIRALEIHQLTGVPISRWQQDGSYRSPGFSWQKLGLYRPRNALYERIEIRVDEMVAEGLLEEVRSLLSRGYSPDVPALASVGYREMIAHIQGQVDLPKAITRIKQNTRQYAKRQMTWFGKDQEILWFDARHEEGQLLSAVMKLRAGHVPKKQEREKRMSLMRQAWSQ